MPEGTEMYLEMYQVPATTFGQELGKSVLRNKVWLKS